MALTNLIRFIKALQRSIDKKAAANQRLQIRGDRRTKVEPAERWTNFTLEPIPLTNNKFRKSMYSKAYYWINLPSRVIVKNENGYSGRESNF